MFLTGSIYIFFPSLTSQCYSTVPTLCRFSTFSWVKTCRCMWMICLMPWPFHLQGRPQCPVNIRLDGTYIQQGLGCKSPSPQPQLYLISIDHQAPLSSCNCLLLRSRYSPQHPQSPSSHCCEAHTKQQVTVKFCVFQSPYIQTANRKPNDLNWIVETICQILASPIKCPCMHFHLLSLINTWSMPHIFKIYLH
jgi:hypothetical protein